MDGPLDVFLQGQHTALATVYEEPESVEVSSMAHQPEALLLYERLLADELGTRKAWNEYFPEGELARLATFFGLSFD